MHKQFNLLILHVIFFGLCIPPQGMVAVSSAKSGYTDEPAIGDRKVLPLDKWTYIGADSSRKKWGDWDQPEWLKSFGLDMADVTGDGFLDIVAGRYFYRNPGGDMSGKWPRVDFHLNVDGMLFVDVDDDRFGDVIASALPDVYWLEALDGQGNDWTAVRIARLPATGHVNGQGYKLAQILPGGKPEILLAAGDGTHYLEIPDNPVPAPWPSVKITDGTMDEGIGTGDIDRDDDVDIVVGREHDERFSVVWFENPGDGSGLWPEHLVGRTAYAPDRIVLDDIDGDGRLDVVVSEERYPGPDPDASLYWFEQPDFPADEEWTGHVVITEYSLNNLDVADLDLDGDADIVTCEHKGPNEKLQIFENDGRGKFSEHIIDRGKESHLGARLADLDGDGDLDIVSVPWDEYQLLHVWRNEALSNPRSVRWVHISSQDDNRLPMANVGRQSAAIVPDIDGDGTADIVVAGWSDPSMVWLRRTAERWDRYVIDDRKSHIEAGGDFYDIDGDGDLDILQGGSWAVNQVWWWENPYPNFDPARPWNRYTIKDWGQNQHHDQIFGDFDGDGQAELVLWNQHAQKLFIADVPARPKKQKNWNLIEIWSWPKEFKYEGLAKADIDLDGETDLIGGGYWFKHEEATTYTPNRIDEYGTSRSAAGDLIKGGRPEIVLCSGDGIGALNIYCWDKGSWHRETLIDTVDHGHTLQVADINGDGNLDIYTAEMYRPGAGEQCKQWILYGDGRGSFSKQIVSVGIGTHEGKLGDLDGDGDLDILQKDFQEHRRVDVWLNEGTAKTDAVWWNTDYEVRIPIRVGAAGYKRVDKPAEVIVDFGRVQTGDSPVLDADINSLRLVEITKEGYPVDDAVPFQVEKKNSKRPRSPVTVKLTLMLTGTTDAEDKRLYHLYAASERRAIPAITFRSRIAVEDDIRYQGQESFKITTEKATYYYHKKGAGFAGLEDPEGNDWIGYNPGVGAVSQSGSGGQYRGLPNMGHPEGYCHPGNTASHSHLVDIGPLKVSFLSVSNDQKMECLWDVFPDYARLTVQKMRKPFWFLYEGTPGGTFEQDLDYCIRSSESPGDRLSTALKWDGDISSPGMPGEWVCFGDGFGKGVLYIIHHQDDEAVDSYWPMNEEMTVFGFGRLGLEKFMRITPTRFTVGLSHSTDDAEIRRIIDCAYQPLTVYVGQFERR